MKMVFRITAILNLCLVVLSFICTIIGVFNRSVDFLAMSVLAILVSIFPTVLMMVLCNDFNENNQ